MNTFSTLTSPRSAKKSQQRNSILFIENISFYMENAYPTIHH